MVAACGSKLLTQLDSQVKIALVDWMMAQEADGLRMQGAKGRAIVIRYENWVP